MKKSSSTNPGLVKLIEGLAKKSHDNNAPIWKDLARRLARSSQRRAEMNLSRISRYAKEKDIIVVPGKILGDGTVGHKITIAAVNFSDNAKNKILSAGGKCISIEELVEKYPKGSGVKIME